MIDRDQESQELELSAKPYDCQSTDEKKVKGLYPRVEENLFAAIGEGTSGDNAGVG